MFVISTNFLCPSERKAIRKLAPTVFNKTVPELLLRRPWQVFSTPHLTGFQMFQCDSIALSSQLNDKNTLRGTFSGSLTTNLLSRSAIFVEMSTELPLPFCSTVTCESITFLKNLS